MSELVDSVLATPPVLRLIEVHARPSLPMHKLSVIAQGIQDDSRRDLDLLLEEMDVSGVRVQHLHVLKQHENGNCGYHALKNVTLAVQACFTKSMEEAKARLVLTENRPFF